MASHQTAEYTSASPARASMAHRGPMVSAAHQIEHFDAEGTIVNVDPAKHLLTIKHGDIKGLMSAMTMAVS